MLKEFAGPGNIDWSKQASILWNSLNRLTAFNLFVNEILDLGNSKMDKATLLNLHWLKKILFQQIYLNVTKEGLKSLIKIWYILGGSKKTQKTDMN